MKTILFNTGMMLFFIGMSGCSLTPIKGLLDIPKSWGQGPVKEAELPDTNPSIRVSDVTTRSWKLGGKELVKVGPQQWLDESGQALIFIECGHIREWKRPGVNLESLRPLQGDPFLLPDPNQLVSSQTWFWAVTVSGDTPRVAQSRYLKEKTAGGYIITELWEIKDLNYSVKNRYEFDLEGLPLNVAQAIHPSLPDASMASNEGVPCE